MLEPGSEAIWLWLGTAGMFLATIYFVARGWGVEEDRRKKFYIVTTFITAIAFVNYLAMALGFGLVEVTVGGETIVVYWARYTDWIFTTPLLLIDLGLLAGADRNTIGTLVGLDVLMIGTGAIATLTGDGGAFAAGAQRLIWWGVSTAFLVVLLYFLFGALSEQADALSAEAQSKFVQLRNLLTVLWAAYPVWWIVGTEGLGLIGLPAETAGFALLDLTAKAGFGYILLRSHAVLDEAGTIQRATPTA
ncbi:bacteriorhodopsin [Natronoarchaeum philippinense]|uniref:Bacteriorhodopsin n=1 Tax=Natronoarchaeum philippinense TaxID=558529 RepID=A0A285P275_NATPI|nr:bacteriorhodopsin [Natronoarchaeum philippinense]SNZ15842.1 bacteriorhodopsin [Natronoarchaeum philippinense]